MSHELQRQLGFNLGIQLSWRIQLFSKKMAGLKRQKNCNGKDSLSLRIFTRDTTQYKSRSKYLEVHKTDSAMEVFNSKYVLKSLLNQGQTC